MNQCTPRYKNKRQTEYAVETVSVLKEAMEMEDGVCLSAEELIAHVNRTLHWAKRISYAKFMEYQEAVRTMGQEEIEEQELFDPTYGWLYDAYMEKRFDHKKELFSDMRNANGNGWIKFRWIMERIFPDFDLKQRNMQLKQKTAPKKDNPIEKPSVPIQKGTPRDVNKKENTELDEEVSYTREQLLVTETEMYIPPPLPPMERWREPDGINLTSEDFKAALFAGRRPPVYPPPKLS